MKNQMDVRTAQEKDIFSFSLAVQKLAHAAVDLERKKNRKISCSANGGVFFSMGELPLFLLTPICTFSTLNIDV
ncbi:hypothetical protein AN957_22535 [Cytobacillus solani]|uniref:Uncharacterized protein n=1 Tax=Cytobacillus solani TaxID=1637975 RepID=A0A0Q3VJ20_9BACI|nr:hypothetical protein AMS60_17070 [Bacillus sp. FJAT-21945]KQL21071.1 hypothetical protein AN957_22535 [Cytobacillus solani]